MNTHTYIIVRDDLKSLEYKGVQAGHAGIRLTKLHPSKVNENGYLIHVTVKNEEQLQFW